MENDGIQRLLKAEDDAAAVIQKAREARAARLRQAAVEADRSAAELRKQLQSEFKSELASNDAGDSSFQQQLADQVKKDQQAIQQGYQANHQTVVDLLLHHVTTVNLEVSEALRQSLLTKKEQGTE